MKLSLKGKKETGFKLDTTPSLNIITRIYSDQIYSTGGYGIYFDTKLDYIHAKLEVIIKSVTPPPRHAPQSMMPASAYLFRSYTDSPLIDYEKSTGKIKGPKGAKLEIILKDNFCYKGKEDKYEITF